MEHPGIGYKELLRMLYKTVDDMEAFSDTSNTCRPRTISVEAVEGFLKRHCIWTCYTDVWMIWRAFLIHPTHTDRSSIYVEDVEGFLNSHHTWTC